MQLSIFLRRGQEAQSPGFAPDLSGFKIRAKSTSEQLPGTARGSVDQL